MRLNDIRNQRVLRVWLWVGVLWVGGGQAVWGQTPPVVAVDPYVAAVRQARPSTAAVGSYFFKDKPTVKYMGTGFVIGDGNTVATNAHVVDGVKRKKRIRHMRVFFPDDRPTEGRKAWVRGYDAGHDVAILRFEGPPVPALTLELTEPAQGQLMGVLGYPIGLRLGLVPAAHQGVVAAVVPAVLPLPPGKRLTPQLAAAIRKPYNLYQLDLVVYPGNSGSPLFDAKDGRVFGIINKTLASKTREHLLTKPSGIAYAVPSRWIHALLAHCEAISDEDRKEELKRLGLLGDQ